MKLTNLFQNLQIRGRSLTVFVISLQIQIPGQRLVKRVKNNENLKIFFKNIFFAYYKWRHKKSLDVDIGQICVATIY